MVSVSLAELLRWGNPHSWLPGALGSPSSPRRGLGAPFFVAHLGTWTSCGLHRGVVSRGRDGMPEADETLLERRAGALRIVTLSKVRGRL